MTCLLIFKIWHMKLKIKKYLKENRILNLFVKNEVDEKSELELITFPLILPIFFFNIFINNKWN